MTQEQAAECFCIKAKVMHSSTMECFVYWDGHTWTLHMHPYLVTLWEKRENAELALAGAPFYIRETAFVMAFDER